MPKTTTPVPNTHSGRWPFAPVPEIALRQVVSEADGAAFCGVSLPHFRRLRRAGQGPRYVRLGIRRVGYSLASLVDWLDARSRGS